MQTNQRIDGVRLWDSLMDMARFGATPKGGVKRLTLTDIDRQGRDYFRGCCEAAGLAVRVDAMGNMFARREGRDPTRLPVLFGSHLDSQPTGGKFDGALGVIAGLEVMRSLDQLAAAMIGAEPIAYSSAVQPSWLTLEADPDLLEQAMINLLKNAVDAVRGRDGGFVRLTCTLEEDQVALTVADNGPGLPADDPEGVFVPFFTTKDGGSGIGLTLARQIALSHGGRLEYRAAHPHGAIFQLLLPQA